MQDSVGRLTYELYTERLRALADCIDSLQSVTVDTDEVRLKRRLMGEVEKTLDEMSEDSKTDDSKVDDIPF